MTRKKVMVRACFGLSMFALVAGCVPAAPPPQAQVDPAIQSLSKLAEGIHKDLGQLAMLERAKVQAEVTPMQAFATPRSGPLATSVTLRWAGPIAPAVQMVAEMVGYQFKEVGAPPAQPPMVNLDAINRPAFEVLEDFGWQAGEKVGVVVDDGRRLIQVIYVGGGL